MLTFQKVKELICKHISQLPPLNGENIAQLVDIDVAEETITADKLECNAIIIKQLMDKDDKMGLSG